MKAGLRCWDENGNNIFDSTSMTSIFLGTFSTNRKDGSFHDDRLKNGEPFLIPVYFSDDFDDEDAQNHAYHPELYTDGNNGFRWHYGYYWSSRGINCEVTYAYGVIPR